VGGEGRGLANMILLLLFIVFTKPNPAIQCNIENVPLE